MLIAINNRHTYAQCLTKIHPLQYKFEDYFSFQSFVIHCSKEQEQSNR